MWKKLAVFLCGALFGAGVCFIIMIGFRDAYTKAVAEEPTFALLDSVPPEETSEASNILQNLPVSADLNDTSPGEVITSPQNDTASNAAESQAQLPVNQTPRAAPSPPAQAENNYSQSSSTTEQTTSTDSKNDADEAEWDNNT